VFVGHVVEEANGKPEIKAKIFSGGQARTKDIRRDVGITAGNHLTGIVNDGILTKERVGPAVIYRVKETVQR